MMAKATSLTKTRPTPTMVYDVIDIQQIKLGGCFEGFIINRYGSYDVLRSGFKYIRCVLIGASGHLTITLIIGFHFVTTFSPHLFVGRYICFSNFGVTFRN